MGVTLHQYRCSIGSWYMVGPKTSRARKDPSTAPFTLDKMVFFIGFDRHQSIWKSRKCCVAAITFLFILLTLGGECIMKLVSK